jgi:DNA-binding NarL/FixJ family response regulator
MGIITSTAAADARRVLIVDDHPVVREGLRMVIGLDPRLAVCGEAGSLAEGIRQFRELRPDLVLVDITLQNGSGLELTKSLVAGDRGAMVLVTSVHDEKLYAERVLRAGARGFVSKSAPTGEVVQAIHRVLEGGLYFSEQMTERLLRRLGGNSTEEIVSPVDSLSDRELEVFEHIGHGLTTRQIAERLHLSRKTIETYREHIKAKLGIGNATELTQRAVQWVMEQDGGTSESRAAESH